MFNKSLRNILRHPYRSLTKDSFTMVTKPRAQRYRTTSTDARASNTFIQLPTTATSC